MGGLSRFLLLINFVATSWWWLAVLLGVVVLLVVLLAVALYAVAKIDAEQEKLAALVARADQQHAWVLAGDDRGVYGHYRPEKI